jgi:hypothetical protein
MPAPPPADALRQRYLLTPPDDTRPSLLVELCAKVDATVLGEVREAMHGLGCAHGLVLDALECEVLRDTYETTGPDSIKVDAVLETPRLLTSSSATLEGKLVRWLDALTKNWTSAVPREPWAAPLLADVVPAAAGSVVRRTMSALAA